MSNYSSAAGKIRELIDASASLEPLALMVSGLLTEIEQVAKTVEPAHCDDIAEIFFKMCTGRDENDRFLPDRKAVDKFQRVLILSIVGEMNFPDSRQAEGFHYWADKCSVELIDIGGFFFEQEEPEELKLVLSLMKIGKISEFAQTSLFAELYEVPEDEMKKLISERQFHVVWLGAFANLHFTSRENIQWLIENFPDLELIDLVKMIEEFPLSYTVWEYPFLYFSREERVTDNVIAYLIEILEDGYTFRNEGEQILARELLEWEEWDKEFDNFLSLAAKVCSTNEDLLRRAQNSSLASLVEAVSA
jgi:hypothetical protein